MKMPVPYDTSIETRLIPMGHKGSKTSLRLRLADVGSTLSANYCWLSLSHAKRLRKELTRVIAIMERRVK